MIFTPEESKQIAEMLGLDVSRFFVSADERYKGEDYYAFPDFSLPEWTGPMLEKVLAHGDEYNTVAFSPSGAVWWTYRGQNGLVFDSGNRNLNLFHLWKRLREQKEVSDVRPE